jgi:hypothetical protein
MRILTRIYNYLRYDIPIGIENLFTWFPVIWKDRNWSERNIFIILRKKLQLTEQSFRKYGDLVNSETEADQIKRCIEVLDRLINDVYNDIAFKEFYKRWGESQIKFGNDGTVDFVYNNIKNEEEEKQCDYEFDIACKYKERLKKQDIERLFHIMKRHIKEWWN